MPANREEDSAAASEVWEAEVSEAAVPETGGPRGSRAALPGDEPKTASLDPGAPVRRLLLATFAFGVLLLSLASTKRGLYLLPLLPALAACIAWWLAGVEGGRAAGETPAAGRSWDRPTLLALLALAGLAATALALAAAVLRWAPRLGAGIDPLRSVPSRPGLAAFALLAGAASAVLLVQLVRHLARRTAPRPTALVGAYLVLFLSWQTAGKALVDPVKNLHDMTAAVARLNPGDGPVAAYRPSESVLAIVNYDLGRRVLPLAQPADLAAHFARQPGAVVLLALDAARQLPPGLRSRLRLVYDETGRKASPFGLAVAASRGMPIAETLK